MIEVQHFAEKLIGAALSLLTAGVVWIARSVSSHQTRLSVLESHTEAITKSLARIERTQEMDAKENRENLSRLTDYIIDRK
jgi:hypothetical protein